MRCNNKQINNPKIIRDILKTADTVCIAMIDGDEPYIVPLNYGYKNNALYIHCAKEGHKIDILKKIHVCVSRLRENSNLLQTTKPVNGQ